MRVLASYLPVISQQINSPLFPIAITTSCFLSNRQTYACMILYVECRWKQSRFESKQNDIVILIIDRNSSKEYLNNRMKSKQISASKSPKNIKRTSLTEANFSRDKSAIAAARDEDYLVPMHIKIPKGKSKAKKQNKLAKTDLPLEERATKRNYKKRIGADDKGTELVDLAIENGNLKKTGREGYSNLTKGEEKTKRNSKGTIVPKQSSKQCWFNNVRVKKTLTQTEENFFKSQQMSKQINLLARPHQEYLFIGNEFYRVNNYCPTKRLLNTFREACVNQNTMSKFIPQDRGDKKSRMKTEVKKNIFQAARKEIEMKNRNCKAIIIQKWWRRMVGRRSLQTVKINPENVKCVLKLERDGGVDFVLQNVTPIKPITKDASVDSQSFEAEYAEDSINGKIVVKSNHEIGQTNLPKKIEFHNEDFSVKLMAPYVLPQEETNILENDDIFKGSTKFHVEEAVNFDQSDDSGYVSPIKSQRSFDEAKDGQCLYKDNEYIDLTLLQQFQEAARTKELIDLRIAVQKGQIKSAETSAVKLGINTSILGVHNFLVRFFNFYIQKYREEFISYINMPFGQSINTRMRQLNGVSVVEEVEEDDEGIIYGLKQVIDQDKYQEFYKWLELREDKNSSTFAKTNLELERIHNKAILDVFNAQLNSYRPYRLVNGVPYPWIVSHKALTFYFVTEDNIAEIFQKVELKILKASSQLCGIILTSQKRKQVQQKPQCFGMAESMNSYQSAGHRLTVEHNNERESKVIREQMNQQSFQYDYESLTSILFQISSSIFGQLLQESIEQMSCLPSFPNIY